MNIKLSSLNKGLVGHWTMSQDSLKGSLLADKTPYSNDGTIHGAPSFTTDRMGQPNKAMSFDGVDDYVNCGHDVNLNIRDAITISVWVKSNQLVTDRWRHIVGKGAISPYAIFLEWSSNGGIYKFEIDSGTRFVSSGPENKVGVWMHLIGTYDKNDGVLNMYKDGVFYSKLYMGETGKLINSAQSRDFSIGGISSSSFFPGTINDARIYNRALSEEEIKTLYNSYNPNIKMKTSLPKIKLCARYGNK